MSSLVERGAGVRRRVHFLLFFNIVDSGYSFYMVIFSVHLAGVSFVFRAINFITTVVNIRRYSIAFVRVSLFTWSVFTTSLLLLLSLPLLVRFITVSLTDCDIRVSFFDPVDRGGSVLFHYLSWFFVDPKFYACILILPGFSFISHVVISYRLKERVFSIIGVIYFILFVGFLGFIV